MKIQDILEIAQALDEIEFKDDERTYKYIYDGFRFKAHGEGIDLPLTKQVLDAEWKYFPTKRGSLTFEQWMKSIQGNGCQYSLKDAFNAGKKQSNESLKFKNKVAFDTLTNIRDQYRTCDKILSEYVDKILYMLYVREENEKETVE